MMSTRSSFTLTSSLTPLNLDPCDKYLKQKDLRVNKMSCMLLHGLMFDSHYILKNDLY